MSIFDGFEPKSVYRYFEEISKIPRNSYHEEKISGYLVDFAKKRGLKFIQDEHYNVVIEKEASPGYEERKKIILQAHMDMVCVAAEGVDHDFSREPIELVRDGDYVRAKGTTLGSDDGNGVALILAILENDDIPHPRLQAIITVAEEVGMVGARNLDARLVDGDYIIGLDYSESKDILVSGAGTVSCALKIPVETAPVEPADLVSYVLNLKGLSGGHSGSQIIRGRGNAIRIMAEALSSFKSAYAGFRIASFSGGDKRNVIPSWANAQVLLQKKDETAFVSAVKRFDVTIRSEYRQTDPHLIITAAKCGLPQAVYQTDTEEKLLDVLDLIPAGVQNYLDAERTHVKSSINVGILKEEDKNIVIEVHARSNSEYQAEQIIRRISAAARRSGAVYTQNFRIPAWQFDPSSTLSSKIQDIWEKTRGYRPELAVMHAGIEQGIFIQKMGSCGKKLESVSIGAHSIDVHTPNERLEIATLGQAYELLAAILRDLQ